VKSFLEPENDEARAVKHVTQCDWSQVPHLDETAKAQLLASTPLYQRDARTKGIPQLGSGAIYPLAESEIIVPRFDIPAHWPRSYGLDVGRNRTAAVWGALDRDKGIAYLYNEYSRAQAEPVIHAAGIKAMGDWIPGVVDPACMGSSQVDGRNLMEMYGSLGLKLQPAVNAVETGIYEVWDALSTGRLKVFDTLPNWANEFRKYHRDEKGKIGSSSRSSITHTSRSHIPHHRHCFQRSLDRPFSPWPRRLQMASSSRLITPSPVLRCA
jgi:hypothetical protein